MSTEITAVLGLDFQRGSGVSHVLLCHWWKFLTENSTARVSEYPAECRLLSRPWPSCFEANSLPMPKFGTCNCFQAWRVRNLAGTMSVSKPPICGVSLISSFLIDLVDIHIFLSMNYCVHIHTYGMDSSKLQETNSVSSFFCRSSWIDVLHPIINHLLGMAFLMGLAPLAMAILAMAKGTSMSRHNTAMRTLVPTSYRALNEQNDGTRANIMWTPRDIGIFHALPWEITIYYGYAGIHVTTNQTWARWLTCGLWFAQFHAPTFVALPTVRISLTTTFPFRKYQVTSISGSDVARHPRPSKEQETPTL